MERTQKSLDLPIFSSSTVLVGMDGKRLSVTGVVDGEIKSKQKSINCKANVMLDARRNLLGVQEIVDRPFSDLQCYKSVGIWSGEGVF